MPLEFPRLHADGLAWISEEEMIEVDRVMIEDLDIELMQMMENAGRALSNLVRERSGAERIVVAAGSGGNGGGGLVAARHLANAGRDVSVVTTTTRDAMTPVPGHQLDILLNMGIAVGDDAAGAELLIDAVIGYSLRGAPRGASADLIEGASTAKSIVSLDTPSGLNVTTGEVPGVVVSADATLTLALPKTGLRKSPHVGELYLADISVPRTVTASYGKPAPEFGTSGILHIVEG